MQAADWWSLGCFLYWMVEGKTPFAAEGDEDLQIYRKINERQLNISDRFSPAGSSFLSELLTVDPNKRLGNAVRGVDAIKDHPFFDCIDWEQLSGPMIDAVPVPLEIKDRL